VVRLGTPVPFVREQRYSVAVRIRLAADEIEKRIEARPIFLKQAGKFFLDNAGVRLLDLLLIYFEILVDSNQTVHLIIRAEPAGRAVVKNGAEFEEVHVRAISKTFLCQHIRVPRGLTVYLAFDSVPAVSV